MARRHTAAEQSIPATPEEALRFPGFQKFIADRQLNSFEPHEPGGKLSDRLSQVVIHSDFVRARAGLTALEEERIYNKAEEADNGSVAGPLEFGKYSEYEKTIVQTRYENLVAVYRALERALASSGIDGFKINHTILWQICFLYANELKVLRQFHNLLEVDRTTRAALLTRLIAHYRPISIAELAVDIDSNGILLELNALFAMQTLFNFLMLPQEAFDRQGMAEVQKNLLFLLSHRDAPLEALRCIAGTLLLLDNKKIATAADTPTHCSNETSKEYSSRNREKLVNSANLFFEDD